MFLTIVFFFVFCKRFKKFKYVIQSMTMQYNIISNSIENNEVIV